MSVGRFFDYFRFCRGESQNLVAKRILDAIHESPEETIELQQLLQVAEVRDLDQASLRKFIKSLEGTARAFPPSLFQVIAPFYGISTPLLASFLRVAPIPSIVTASLDHLTRLVVPDLQQTYYLPSFRLAESDISVSVAEYQPSQKSQPGSHPGDEMIYVLNGEIDVGFSQTGIETRVKKGQYIQFHAERPHYLFAPKKILTNSGKLKDNIPTRLLVIRFFQFRTTSHRAAIRRLRLDLPGISKPTGVFADFLEHEISWLVAFNHIGDHEMGTRVVDFHGLSRLAVMLSSEAYRRHGTSLPKSQVSGKQLEARAKQLLNHSDTNENAKAFLKICKERFFDEAIHVGKWGPWRLGKDITIAVSGEELEEGGNDFLLNPKTSGLSKSQLKLLASVYGNPFDVSPMLFYEFLFPAERGVVKLAAKDWQRMDGETDSKQSNPDALTLADYFVPIRRLALSDAAIFQVHFPPGSKDKPASTPKNRHPGSELCVCLEGAVEIAIEGSVPVTIQKNCFAHFKSSQCHCLTNRSPNPAKILVVRFYGDEKMVNNFVRGTH